MNWKIPLLPLIMLSACATSPVQPKLAQPRSVLPSEYVSPDAALVIRFHVHPNQSHYEVIDRSGTTHRATAQSRIVADDFHEGRFRGTQDVIFADDGSGAVITEDVSDASQSFRHILISRNSNGPLRISYLQPPWRRFTHEPVEFNSEPPIATALTADRITFYYPSSRSTSVLPLARVQSSTSPKFDPNE